MQAVCSTTMQEDGPVYVAFRQERSALPDGRRCSKWYLVQAGGKVQLAAVGEESERRDAHYNYRAVCCLTVSAA